MYEYYGNNDYRDYLIHHGILGMKWGVRRYQNKDGSYTKAGLERYRKAEDHYRQSSKKVSSTKEAYKTGSGSKADYKIAKREQKKAKKELSRTYDRLKNDYLADQGKELYRSGKTITDNYSKLARNAILVNTAGYLTKAALRNSNAQISFGKYGSLRVRDLAPAAIITGGNIANIILSTKNNYEAKRLRAYYAH